MLLLDSLQFVKTKNKDDMLLDHHMFRDDSYSELLEVPGQFKIKSMIEADKEDVTNCAIAGR